MMLLNVMKCVAGMRTSLWRYAEWPAWKCYGMDGNPDRCSDMSKPGAIWASSADWSDLAGRELYSHKGDLGDCFAWCALRPPCNPAPLYK